MIQHNIKCSMEILSQVHSPQAKYDLFRNTKNTKCSYLRRMFSGFSTVMLSIDWSYECQTTSSPANRRNRRSRPTHWTIQVIWKFIGNWIFKHLICLERPRLLRAELTEAKALLGMISWLINRLVFDRQYRLPAFIFSKFSSTASQSLFWDFPPQRWLTPISSSDAYKSWSIINDYLCLSRCSREYILVI